jgi:hypothetical protein
MSSKPKLLWALIAGLALASACDDGSDSDGAASDASRVAVDASADAIVDGALDQGPLIDMAAVGEDSGIPMACDEAANRIASCIVDEPVCPAFGPGGPGRDDIFAGLQAGCLETPALAAVANGHMGDCTSLIDTLSAASAEFAASCIGPVPVGPDLSTPLAIEAWLDGKRAVMAGADIPEWPLGYFEGANYGEATQCYASLTLRYVDLTFISDADFGVLEGAPDEGAVGTCDHTASSRLAQAVTQGHSIEGDGSCFDMRMAFSTYTLEGRGSFNPDGRTLRLEVFYEGQATGISCLDGAVGAPGVQVSGMDLGGDAVQVFRVND